MLYLIIGRKEGYEDVYYGACHSIKRAEELCYEAEDNDEDGRYYEWFPILELDD